MKPKIFFFFLLSSLSFSTVFPLPLIESHPEVNALIHHTQRLECTEDPDFNSQSFENEYTIIARLLTEKPINMGAFKSTILKA